MNKYYYKIHIQYDGSPYYGFQWQNELASIQGEIDLAFNRITGEKTSSVAASRTDTGVHAIEQIVKITTLRKLELDTVLTHLNKTLPAEIQCHFIEECAGDYRPTTGNRSKKYLYFFTNDKIAKKENLKYIANISNQLDFEKINQCTKALIGKHDFCNFYSEGSNVTTTVRTIIRCEVKEINPSIGRIRAIIP